MVGLPEHDIWMTVMVGHGVVIGTLNMDDCLGSVMVGLPEHDR